MRTTALKKSVSLKRSAIHSSLSYAENTVVTGACNRQQCKKVMGNPYSFLMCLIDLGQECDYC